MRTRGSPAWGAPARWALQGRPAAARVPARRGPRVLCCECLRTCPYDNIAVTLRPFGADLPRPAGRRLDEAFKGFLMLGSALAYSAVLLGPWGGMKLGAFCVGTPEGAAFAGGVLAATFLALPGAFALHVAAGRLLAGPRGNFRETLASSSPALLPP